MNFSIVSVLVLSVAILLSVFDSGACKRLHNSHRGRGKRSQLPAAEWDGHIPGWKTVEFVVHDPEGKLDNRNITKGARHANGQMRLYRGMRGKFHLPEGFKFNGSIALMHDDRVATPELIMNGLGLNHKTQSRELTKVKGHARKHGRRHVRERRNKDTKN